MANLAFMPTVDINNEMITWAIARAGYGLDEFVLRFPRADDWLQNKKKPTLKQLEDFSRKVYLPFGYLFLDTPPEESLPIPFFRTGKAKADRVSLNVYDTILSIQNRQEWLSEYLQENDYDPLQFVGKHNVQSNYQQIVSDIRTTLKLESEWASSVSNWERALDHLTSQIEDAGIIVTFNSVVGNNTKRSILVEECRGFVLIDTYAPFMFVNSADAKAAQMFTIVHELAHIWIGSSAGFDFRRLMPASDPVEELCDKVAAEFLVPQQNFLRGWRNDPDIKRLAKHFKVSPIVVARRALDLGQISQRNFFKFYDDYTAEFRHKKEGKSSGGDFYATQRKRLSLSFSAHLDRAIKQEKLLYRDAYKLTGLKGETFNKFLKENF